MNPTPKPRPRDVYGPESRLVILKNLKASGYRPLEFREPVLGDYYVAQLGTFNASRYNNLEINHCVSSYEPLTNGIPRLRLIVKKIL